MLTPRTQLSLALTVLLNLECVSKSQLNKLYSIKKLPRNFIEGTILNSPSNKKRTKVSMIQLLDRDGFEFKASLKPDSPKP